MNPLLSLRVVSLVALVCALAIQAQPAQSQVHSSSRIVLVTADETLASLAAGDATSGGSLFSANSAVAFTDSLLGVVSHVRNLKTLHPVKVRLAGREQVRARLEERAGESGARELEDEERILKYLGLLPEEASLLQLAADLQQDQLLSFYDVSAREMVLADWIPAEQQSMITLHELTHALQDQHFSLRVRRKLGFDNQDSEVAWQALLEGDASAVMLEVLTGTSSAGFATLADSLSTTFRDLGSWCRVEGTPAPVLESAPDVVRESVAFPYARGLRFVAALFQEGGWQRVDDAFIQPPTSTEQVMHPERYLKNVDGPVRVELPDLRGLLGAGYAPLVTHQMGELDLYLYLKQHIDPEIAEISAEGWGGCTVALYGDSPGDPDVLALSSVWDSEDDALEFFGALIGVLEVRYVGQSGWGELSSENQVVWKIDEDGRWVNVLRLRGREVLCLERVPGASFIRLVQKLDRNTRMDDPTPDVRAVTKDKLPWNQSSTGVQDSALTLKVDLPGAWTEVLDHGRDDVILEARRAGARLQVLVDRDAQDQLGVGGFAHVLAKRLQQRGTNVYIEKDDFLPREDLQLYEHVFTQFEKGRQVSYYLVAVDLKRGFGYVILSEPRDGTTPTVQKEFAQILASLRVIPIEDTNPERSTSPSDVPASKGN